jgi:YfiH family protein
MSSSATDRLSVVPPFTVSGVHVAVELAPGAHAVFTTRRGGVSAGPYASLNLGRFTADDPDAVERNRAAVATELGVRLASMRQVHGNRVVRVRDLRGDGEPPPEADGQATALSGVAMTVLTADCLPVAVASKGAVAMLHAGWRGLAAGIIDEGVRAVRELGADGSMTAAIGPGAGLCCYEVGEEVHAALAGESGSARHGDNLDLKGIARCQLERAGVDVIYDVQLCTICSHPSLLYSHRRDRGLTGRQAGIAWLS